MKKHSAFSLVELSLVILVIGIVLVGITAGSRMVADSQISAARQLTLSSPVSRMEGVILWLEPTLQYAFGTGTSTFIDVETPVDADLISRWNDIKPDNPKKHLTAIVSGNRPTYTAKCINSLPCLKFGGSPIYLANTSFGLKGNTLTLFVVAKRIAASGEASMISISATSAANDYDNASSFVAFYEGAAGTALQTYRNGALSTATNLGNNIPFIVSTTFNGATNTLHLNGTAQSAVASTGSFNADRFIIAPRWAASTVGYYYNGYIAEIIMFDRALKVDERKSIEKYLSKKWNITTS